MTDLDATAALQHEIRQLRHDARGWEGKYRMERQLRKRDAARERQALEEITKKQPEMLETLRSHGIVFDGPLGNDPKNWQHVAFSIYTQLCEVDAIARSALANGS